MNESLINMCELTVEELDAVSGAGGKAVRIGGVLGALSTMYDAVNDFWSGFVDGMNS
jgi:hypothetical protein